MSNPLGFDPEVSSVQTETTVEGRVTWSGWVWTSGLSRRSKEPCRCDLDRNPRVTTGFV